MSTNLSSLLYYHPYPRKSNKVHWYSRKQEMTLRAMILERMVKSRKGNETMTKSREYVVRSL